ncbi:MAG TPA: hypothetical protein EYP85_11425 [Armatimonadetes bacterium]|nr:hypothetical protein [Armatimonadota bacterium]
MRRMMAWGLSAFLLLRAGAVPGFEYRDDFADYPAGSDGAPVWWTNSIAWSVREGVYVAEGKGKSFAVLEKAPYAAALVLQATLTLREATGTDWKVAGLVLFRDGRNYWHFALVESPDADGRRHFVELVESYEGVWLAQGEPDTRLTMTADENQFFNWEYNHPYRLRLVVTPEGIEGSLHELDGTRLARRAFRFDNKAVTFGRPGLDNGGFRAEFDDVQVEVTQTVKVQPEKKTYPPYTGEGWPELGGEATGFFRVELVPSPPERGGPSPLKQGVWWVFNPRGEAFYILGTDHANFRVHWCEQLGYAPYHRNCLQKYGTEEAWAESTVQRLRAWHFNSLGANNSPSTRYRGLAHTDFLGLGAGFAGIDDLVPQIHWTGFPNVFHPKFASYCDKIARDRCAPQRDDPWLLGYFLDNELEWYGKSGRPWGIFEEAMKKPPKHTAKRAVVDFLRERYQGDIAAFNAAWGTDFQRFGDLLAVTELVPRPAPAEAGPRPRAFQDRMDFVRLVAERYFATTTAAIRKYDPNHLILGCRFAGRAPDIWDLAGKYCDIVSVNCYRRVDLEREVVSDGFEEDLREWYAAAQRPLMITEWSFPALDSGLPCTHGAGQRFDTQEQRARAFAIFQRLLFRLPFVVGSDYFMWVDEPALGISRTFPENTNYGLVNEWDEPYPELTATATRLNALVYDLHAGRTAELGVELEGDPPRLRLFNRGQTAAECSVEVWLDGQRRWRTLRLAAGETREGTVAGWAGETAMRPGGHYLRVVLDPQGQVPEADRTDNVAEGVYFLGPAERGVPIGVYNRGATSLRGTVVTVPLTALNLPATEGRPTLRVTDEQGQPVPAQVDALPEGAELAFLVAELPSYGCRTFWGVRGGGEGSPEVAVPVEVTREPLTIRVDNGRLRLRKSEGDGDAFDEIVLDGAVLGRFTPLVHQQVGQNLWVAPERVEEVTVYSGPVRTVLDLVFARGGGEGELKTQVGQGGTYAPLQARPHAYRTAYRFIFYPDRAWFLAQFLWLENTDREVWHFQSYYHYTPSFLGGDPAHDRPGGPNVPNYYLSLGAWHDATNGLWLGAVPLRSEDFHLHYWLDGGGGQHPDVWRVIDRDLQPGERFAVPQPAVAIFGARGVAGERPWREVLEEVRAGGQVGWKVTEGS